MLKFNDYYNLNENLITKENFLKVIWHFIRNCSNINLIKKFAIELIEKNINKIAPGFRYIFYDIKNNEKINFIAAQLSLSIHGSFYTPITQALLFLLTAESRKNNKHFFDNEIYNSIDYARRAGLSLEEIEEILKKYVNIYIEEEYNQEFSPEYKTANTINILKTFLINTKQTDTLGILADALQDAGLDNEKFLNGLRSNDKMILLWIKLNLL